jgi:hypothetical protein
MIYYPPQTIVFAASLIVNVLPDESWRLDTLTVLAVNLSDPGLYVSFGSTLAVVIVPVAIPVNVTLNSAAPDVCVATVEPALVKFEPSPLNAVAVSVPVEGLNVNVELTFAVVIVPEVTPVNTTDRSLLAPPSVATVDPALVN